MKIEFENKQLEELYKFGKSRSGKQKYPSSVIIKFTHLVNILKAVESPIELFTFRSLYYKKLKGDKYGIESIRLNNSYRLEFKTSKSNNGDIHFFICAIKRLSNHYQ